MENKQDNKNQLQIQLRPEVADGKYSNLAMIGHGPNEFLSKYEKVFGEIKPRNAKNPNNN